MIRCLATLGLFLTLLLPQAGDALAQRLEVDFSNPDSARLLACKPDVSIKKALSAESVGIDGEVVVTLTVTNTGEGTLSPVNVTDVLDPGIRFDATQTLEGTCPTTIQSYANRKITFAPFSLEEGQSCTIRYVLGCKDPGEHTDVATVEAFCEGDTEDSVTDSDSRTFSCEECIPNVAINKRLSTTNTGIGDDVRVTLLITNNGSTPLTTIEVCDQLDDGVSFDETQTIDGSCGTSIISFENQKVTFEKFSLDAGESCTIEYDIACTDLGTRTDVATVRAFCDASGVFDEDEAKAAFSCECVPQVSIRHEVDRTNVRLGETVRTTLTITNDGGTTLSDIAVCDQLDQGVGFDPNQTLGGSCPTAIADFSDQKICFEPFTLEPGESCTIEYDVTCDSVDQHTNTSSVVAFCEGTDLFDDDRDQETFGCDCVPEVKISQTNDRTNVSLGDEVRVTLEITNEGTTRLTRIAVLEELDDGVGFDSNQALGGDCPTSIASFSNQKISFAPFDLEPGQTCTIEFTVTCDAVDIHSNEAIVTAFCEDTDIVDVDSDEARFGCECVPEVKLTQVVNRTSVQVGDEVMVRLNISNEGTTRLTRIEATDQLDAGVGFDPNQFIGGSCGVGVASFADQKITFEPFDLEPGESCTIEYKVICATLDIHTDRSRVVAFCEDTNVTDEDEDQVTFGCECVPDVKLSQTVDRTSVNVGDDVRVTLLVANSGTTRLTRIEVCDQLDAGVGFDPNQALGGDCDTEVASFIDDKVCFEPFDLDPGESCTIEYTVTCDTEGPHTDRATVVAFCEDTNIRDEDDDQVTFGCDCVPDVNLSQNVDRTAVELGGEVRVTLTVKNDGTTRLTRIAVSDQLDDGVGFDPNQTLGGTCPTSVAGFSNNKIFFEEFELGPGETCTIEYTVTCDSATQHTDRSEVIAYCENTDITDEDQDQVSFGCDCVPAVRLTHDVDRQVVQVGDEVRVTLRVKNEGTTRLTRIAVCDQLDAGVGFDPNQTLGGNCPTSVETFGAQKICFEEFELGPGESCTIEYTVTCDEATIHTNRSTVVAYCEDTEISDTDNDEASFGCDCVPDVDLTHRLDRSTVGVDGEIRVTLQVMNDGETNLTRIAVCDQLDQGVGFDENQSLGGSCPTSVTSFSNQKICFEPFDLAPGESCTIEYTIVCDDTGSKVSRSSAKAFCEDTGIFDEDTDEVTFDCSCVPDIALEQTIDPSTTTLGGDVLVTLRVTNEGSTRLTRIEVCDQLETGVGFDETQRLGGDCPTQVASFSAQKICFTEFDLEPGQSCTIEYFVSCEELDAHTNRSSVIGYCEETDLFDEDTSQASFDCSQPDCDLMVRKTATPDTIIPGPVPDCDSVDDLQELRFRYIGGTCEDSDNTQGSKFECMDSGNLTDGPVSIVYVGDDDDEIFVEPTGEVITLGSEFTLTAVLRDKLRSNSILEVRQGGQVRQTLEIHTSCSAPLEAGDVFGSVQLLELNGQGLPDTEVQYDYVVTNNGDDLFNVSVVDDRLGIIAENLTLPSGASRSFTRTEMITTTTTNRVDVVGYLIDANGPECSAFDEATVTVSDPPGSCDDGKPQTLVFQYTGQDCFASDNGQDDSKFDCEGNSAPGEPVQIVYVGDDDDKIRIQPSTETIMVGDEVRLIADDKLKSETEIEIRRGGQVLQYLRFHTSCSQPLVAGDQFGSLLLTNLIPEPISSATEPDESMTLEGDGTLVLSTETVLYRAVPNPFKGTTRIAYAVPGVGGGAVQVDLFDAAGRRIRTLVNQHQAPGLYSTVWDARDDRGVPVTRGVYYARVVVGAETVATTRILFLK